MMSLIREDQHKETICVGFFSGSYFVRYEQTFTDFTQFHLVEN